MDSTQRFSNRVDDYVRYRPHYPSEIMAFLEEDFGMMPGSFVADIGAGTGISSMLFLNAGYRVLGVEPNKEMRTKSVELLGQSPNFLTVNGTAEQTNLPAASVDAIVAGQAFHWFDAAAARSEFTRILRPGSPVVLIWNERATRTAFEQEYDALILRHGHDYVAVQHRNIGLPDIESFFSPATCTLRVFEHFQQLDLEGLKGRLLSSSYMPVEGQEGYAPMILALQDLFERHQQQGLITIQYDTKVYAGIWK